MTLIRPNFDGFLQLIWSLLTRWSVMR